MGWVFIMVVTIITVHGAAVEIIQVPVQTKVLCEKMKNQITMPNQSLSTSVSKYCIKVKW